MAFASVSRILLSSRVRVSWCTNTEYHARFSRCCRLTRIKVGRIIDGDSEGFYGGEAIEEQGESEEDDELEEDTLSEFDEDDIDVHDFISIESAMVDDNASEDESESEELDLGLDLEEDGVREATEDDGDSRTDDDEDDFLTRMRKRMTARSGASGPKLSSKPITSRSKKSSKSQESTAENPFDSRNATSRKVRPPSRKGSAFPESSKASQKTGTRPSSFGGVYRGIRKRGAAISRQSDRNADKPPDASAAEDALSLDPSDAIDDGFLARFRQSTNEDDEGAAEVCNGMDTGATDPAQDAPTDYTSLTSEPSDSMAAPLPTPSKQGIARDSATSSFIASFSGSSDGSGEDLATENYLSRRDGVREVEEDYESNVYHDSTIEGGEDGKEHEGIGRKMDIEATIHVQPLFRRRLKAELKREMINRNRNFKPETTGKIEPDFSSLGSDGPNTDAEDVLRRRQKPYQGVRAERGQDGDRPRRSMTEDEVLEMLKLGRNSEGSRRRGQLRPEVQEPLDEADEYVVDDGSGSSVPLRDQFSDDRSAKRFASFLGRMREDSDSEDPTTNSASQFFKRGGNSSASAFTGAKSTPAGGANGSTLRDRLSKMPKRVDRIRPNSGSAQEERIQSQRGIFMPHPEDYPDYDDRDEYARRPLNLDVKLAADSCPSCKGDGLVTCPYCLGEEWIPPLKEYLADPIGDALNRPTDDLAVRYMKRRPSAAMLQKLEEFWRSPNLAINEDGYAQCRFCALGRSMCPKCAGSGSSLTKGFDYEREYRKAFPEELHDDTGLDADDQPYLVFPRYLDRRPFF